MESDMNGCTSAGTWGCIRKTRQRERVRGKESCAGSVKALTVCKMASIISLRSVCGTRDTANEALSLGPALLAESAARPPALKSPLRVHLMHQFAWKRTRAAPFSAHLCVGYMQPLEKLRLIQKAEGHICVVVLKHLPVVVQLSQLRRIRNLVRVGSARVLEVVAEGAQK